MTDPEWTLTRHAEEQMAERAVPTSELHQLLTEGPDEVVASADEPNAEVWWHGTIGAVVNPVERVVITVLLRGATKGTWHEVAASRGTRPDAPSPEVILADMFPEPAPVHGRRKRERRHVFPVQTRRIPRPTEPTFTRYADGTLTVAAYRAKWKQWWADHGLA